MMRYGHILLAVASNYWAIDEDKLDQIVAFLALQASGEKLSDEEVSARIGGQVERDVARREGAVAILPLRGVMANRMNMMSSISGGTSYEAFTGLFDEAVRDPGVKAIVLDVDTPGGVVEGADELAARIYAARGRKPVIAHVNGNAASAGYWVASPADEIVLSPSAKVGSIGVLMVHDDVSQALEKQGIKRTIISAGKFKGEGFQALSEDAIAHRREIAAAYYERFVARVAQGRAVSAEQVKSQFGQGRMVMSEVAVARGMADSIATLPETLARLGASGEARRNLAPARRMRALDL